MRIYRRNTQEIVNRFLNDANIPYIDCMSALDVELANLTVRMHGMESSTAVRILMSVNNEMVAKEMERRRDAGFNRISVP